MLSTGCASAALHHSKLITNQIMYCPLDLIAPYFVKEETIRLINLSYEQTGEGRSGTDLSRRVFENVGKLSHTPSQECLLAIKEEVRRLF